MRVEGSSTDSVSTLLRVWLAGFVVFGTLGTLWAFASPLMSVPDEPSHTVYAAAVVRGQLRGKEVIHRPDAPPGVNAIISLFEVPRPYAALPDLPACYGGRSSTTADCAPELPTSMEPVTGTTYVGRYPPVYYALVGWPTLLPSKGTTAVYAMRVMSVLLSAALFAMGVLAAYVLGPSAWLAAGVALATTPMVLFLAGSVNPNSLEIAAAFALWWLGLALLDPARPVRGWLVSGTAASAVLLTVSRPLSLLFTALIVVTLMVLVATPDRLRELVRDRRAWLAAGVVAAVFAATTAWIVSTDALQSFIAVPIPGLTPAEAARTSYHLTRPRYAQMIGTLGWLDTPAPRTALFLWSWALLALGVLALLLGTWRRRIVLMLMVALTIALPILAETRAADELGFGWQGRYSLPYAVGVPICCAWVLARSRRLSGTVAILGASLLSLCVAGSHVLIYAGALRRYMVGYPAPLFSFLDSAAWDPPIPAVPGLVGVAIVVIGFPGLAFVLSRYRRDTCSSPALKPGAPRVTVP